MTTVLFPKTKSGASIEPARRRNINKEEAFACLHDKLQHNANPISHTSLLRGKFCFVCTHRECFDDEEEVVNKAHTDDSVAILHCYSSQWRPATLFHLFLFFSSSSTIVVGERRSLCTKPLHVCENMLNFSLFSPSSYPYLMLYDDVLFFIHSVCKFSYRNDERNAKTRRVIMNGNECETLWS